MLFLFSRVRQLRHCLSQRITQIMLLHYVVLVLSIVGSLAPEIEPESNSKVRFSYNGFQSVNLALDADGIAQITNNGVLMLTNDSSRELGHAFFPIPLPFKKGKDVVSFSTSFAFAIFPEYETLGGHGLAFAISPIKNLPQSLPSQYLGLFNSNNSGDSTNHVVAVELDTVQDFEFKDMNDNHVGININSLVSVSAASAGYFPSPTTKEFKNMSLKSERPMMLWVDYDAGEKQMNVTLAPINVPKPKKPLLSYSRDLSPILRDTMYVGFSAASGLLAESHYILGWSFALDGPAPDLDPSRLPMPPGFHKDVSKSKLLTIGLPLILVMGVSVIVLSLIYVVVARKRKFVEELEEWEMKYGPHRFKYKDLYVATRGFNKKQLLGKGGFGKVYKGILPDSNGEIAVKRVSHDSKQGIREFVAEIVSSGRLRHRNLVPLLGYCRRKGELLLVYDYMPNGSLDKYLYNQPTFSFSWEQRFGIIKGVASGLLYLHEEWEQVVIHRDIKSSNVLLDNEFNARLGDFGLARLYDHGSDPHTTHAAGTIGYLAPEHTTTGKASKSTDVYAFGAFLLEVACGRRPIDRHATNSGGVILVNWVFEHWSNGDLLNVVDPNLRRGEYKVEEVELVLKLGLMCSNVEPSARPTMRQVAQYLMGMLSLPDLSSLTLGSRGLTYDNYGEQVGHSGPALSCSYESVLFVGR